MLNQPDPPVADHIFDAEPDNRTVAPSFDVRLRLLLALLVVLLCGLALLSTYKYLQLENQIAGRLSENTIWAATQSEIEYLRFLHSLDTLYHSDRVQSASDLEQQFDILWSRIDLYRSGRLQRFVAGRPELRQIVDAIMADLMAIEPDLKAVVAGETDKAEIIHQRLLKHAPRLREVSLASLAADREDREEFMTAHAELRAQVVVFGIGAVLAILLLFAFFGRAEWIARTGWTATKRARAAADAANRRLTDVIENISEGFVVFDAESRLVLCNSKYKQIYDRSADLLVPGASFAEILREGAARGQYLDLPDDVEAWIAGRIARRATQYTLEQALCGGRWVIVSERPTIDGGTVGVRTDITEIKRREAQLRAANAQVARQADQLRDLADEALRANRAKSEFLAMISHEIRTPMNAVIGLSDLLGETPLDRTQSRYLQAITEAATRLLGLINDLLDFASIEAGRLTLVNVPFAPGDMLRGAIELVQILADNKRLDLTTYLSEAVPPLLIGDPGRLHQVLVNLLGNAVKYTDEGKVHVEVTSEPDGEGFVLVSLTVADTGPGIDEDLRARLFQPFERGHAASQSNTTGTGLGLALTARLVSMMNGTIDVASELGLGTAFCVRIRLAIADAAAQPSPLSLRGAAPSIPSAAVRDNPLASEPAPAPAGPRFSVLVAEDTPTNQMIVEAMLARGGHRCTLVNDGAQAIARAAKQPFDLILMDLQMPVMNGLEAARAIRASSGPNAATRMIALTAQARRTDRDRALAAGFDEFLTKPLRMEEMDRALANTAETLALRRAAGRPGLDDEDLDRTVLDEMRDSVGPAVFARLLEQFHADLNVRLQDLSEAVAAGDAASLVRIAHRLSGLLAQFGLTQAAAMAQAVETETNPDLQRATAMRLVGNARATAQRLSPPHNALASCQTGPFAVGIPR